MVARVIRVACFAAVICFFPEAAAASDPPAHITKTAGDNQNANIGVQFGAALQVTVTDSSSHPVSGATVTFTVNAGTSGASGTLTNSGGTSSSTSVTASTNSSGVASGVATANSTAGGWTVTASVSGVSATPSFALTNNTPFVIASNLPGNDGLSDAFTSGQALAVGFQMTTTVLFSSATLRLNAVESMPVSDVVVGLYQDNGSGAPGTLIETLTGPSVWEPSANSQFPVPQDYGYLASPAVTLTSGQKYWLVLQYSGSFAFSWDSDSSNNLSGIVPTGQITYVNTLFANPYPSWQTFSQNGAPQHPSFALNGVPPLTLGTSQIYVGPQAGSSSAVVAATEPWAATANDSWLHVASGSDSGTGNALFQFTYDANTGSTRTGTITIADQTLTVTQAGSTYEATSEVTTLASSGLSAPENIALDSSGDVYFVDFNHNAVKKWNASTENVSTVVSTGFLVKGIALDPAGDVYLSDYTDGNLDQWQVSGNKIVTLTPFNGSPAGEATDPSGNVYIGDITNLQIDEWNPSTGTLSTVVTGLNSPEDVAADAASNVYIMNRGNNTVQEWNSAAQQLSTLFTGPSGSNGVAVDGQGNVYVAAVPIEEWNASTGQVAPLVSSGLSSPYALRTDALGNLYYTDVALNTLNKVTFALVGPSTFSELATAGTDQMLPVLPTGTPLDAVSDSTWLTITSQTGGVVAFSFTANTSATSRTAHITVLGASIPVTQAADVPAAIAATAGTPQSATVGQQFATALQVTVTDSNNNPVTGVTVTFAAPSSGASATFSSSTATTNSSGVASVTATANSTSGSYNVTASVTGVSTPATFSLTNDPIIPPSVTITSGNNQSANINVQFDSALLVNVTDGGSPVSGATVTFTVNQGSGGSGGTLIDSSGTSSTTSVTATTNSNGNASVAAAANSTAGGWTVTASVSGGSSSPGFTLTNTQPAVIATNLPGNDGLALGMFQNQAYAVGFKMTSAATLSSATLRLRAGNGVNGQVDTVSSVVVGLYQDNGSGKPGTLIQALTGPSVFSPGAPIQDYSYSASPQVTLTSGQTYWLQVEYTGTISFQWESDGSNNLDGITPTGQITYVNTLLSVEQRVQPRDPGKRRRASFCRAGRTVIRGAGIHRGHWRRNAERGRRDAIHHGVAGNGD
jgi:sugar lactone lactonase YvrE